MKSHGHARGGRPTRTYVAWANMKTRCVNPRHAHYSDYGGRGISYDPRWEAFESFLVDMGEAPPGMTLDRRDNSAGYSKENCRWVPQTVQNRNTRANRLDVGRVRQLRWLHEMGYSTYRIGRMYGVSQSLVWQTVRRMVWT